MGMPKASSLPVEAGSTCPNADCNYRPTADELAMRISDSGKMQCPECLANYFVSPSQLKASPRRPAKVQIFSEYREF